jgi:hypothetical protein
MNRFRVNIAAIGMVLAMVLLRSELLDFAAESMYGITAAC